MPITGGDVVDLGRGLYAWLPPKRGWGLANCGLLVSPRGALWIDTPYDRALAGQFLAESTERLPDGVTVDRVIVTHANGDHFWGAGVLPDAEIIATREAREHIHYEPTPQQQHALVTGGDPATPLGAYLARHFGPFDWSATEPVRPTTYFTGELELTLGDYPVRLAALPSAHTTGDLIVHLPAQRAVFSGDVIFSTTPRQPGDHPVHWAGPLSNVIAACERVLATGAEIIVPGHGPVLDPAGVRDHIGYLEYIRERAHAFHTAGVPAPEAARRVIAEDRHPELGLPERLSVTIGTEYRHLDGSELPGVLQVMTEVAVLAQEVEQTRTGGGPGRTGTAEAVREPAGGPR
ncbi:MBL fold metallo-hydrolase [Streptomyces sp. NBC_00654]|uniref:MBL fold metallo-hydrolase n=1 Tax=Streptomyces sp. NBC_00654 TaxID=2975799 RepID=UPI00225549C2|nr:MBL fold metallo-hydrolase [Streptomyces sp. NBC_00654]MCX4965387.1 MBL fold metallo-hydrolase [Streptomyces sp. NBC_00654]